MNARCGRVPGPCASASGAAVARVPVCAACAPGAGLSGCRAIGRTQPAGRARRGMCAWGRVADRCWPCAACARGTRGAAASGSAGSRCSRRPGSSPRPPARSAGSPPDSPTTSPPDPQWDSTSAAPTSRRVAPAIRAAPRMARCPPPHRPRAAAECLWTPIALRALVGRLRGR